MATAMSGDEIIQEEQIKSLYWDQRIIEAPVSWYDYGAAITYERYGDPELKAVLRDGRTVVITNVLTEDNKIWNVDSHKRRT